MFAALLTRLTTLLLFALVAIVGLMMLVGTALPNDERSVMGSNDCVLPCAFGVTPGLTAREAAVAVYDRLSVNPSSFIRQVERSFTLRTSASSGGQTMAIVTFQQPVGGDVRAVRLYDMDSSVGFWRVGDLIQQKGGPTRVFASCGSMDQPKLLFVFDDGTIAQTAPVDRLLPGTPLTLVAVTAELERTLPPLRASFACSVETTWRGFAPYWVYTAGAPPSPLTS